MHREVLIMVCTCDLAGQVRGKGFPARDLKNRATRGVGWTPTNSLITAFGPIADSPWGPHGDLILVPDQDTEVNVDFGDDSPPERFVLGDIRETDGTPWSCCPRDFLRRGLQALEREAGLRLHGSFEHEFVYTGVEPRANSAYSLGSFREQGVFGEALIRALRGAGLEPDTFMAEYAPRQYEITLAPAPALVAADRAVILRELVRATAQRLGQRAIFSPILDPDGVGNGVHIHFSLRDPNGVSVMHDPGSKSELSPIASQFTAGVLHYMPMLCALTTPSVISYQRLTPHRWSAFVNNLGYRDREAGIRICPVFKVPGTAPVSNQFHLEYRAADAAASPYMALGALVWAGLQGIRDKLPAPPVSRDEDLSALSDAEMAQRGLQRLPEFLEDALQLLERTRQAREWLGEPLLDIYLRHKRAEISFVKHLEPEEQCERYRGVY